uniref:Uncharacterized protein n=1 Tax=Oryza glumipatula TaxID=40148 RepID=A0A0E0A4E6_9ORYZ
MVIRPHEMQPIQPTHISKRPARSGPSSRTRGKPRQAPATSSVAAALHTPPAGALLRRAHPLPSAGSRLWFLNPRRRPSSANRLWLLFVPGGVRPRSLEMKKPAAMLAVANHGLASGLPRYDEMDDQSSPIAPMPRPWRPDPSCCASTDLGKIQQIQEREAKLHTNATKKNRPSFDYGEKGDLHEVGRPPHRRRLHQIPPEYSRPPESQHLQNEAQDKQDC